MEALRSNRIFLAIAALVFLVGCGADNKYEVIERTQKDDVPDFQGAGTHTAVNYVLLHDGHEIYAQCDTSDLNKLDQNATCGFRPLRSCECAVQSDNLEKATLPLSDLKCKDTEGHNVYLYVSKKE
jgi:hypothetical protein